MFECEVWRVKSGVMEETARWRGFFDINRRYPNIIKERDNWDIIVGAGHRPARLVARKFNTDSECNSASFINVFTPTGRADQVIRPYGDN